MVPFLDLKRQYKRIEDEILDVTRKVYESGSFILGQEVTAFEEEFARYCGVRYGVGVGSGTDALALALKAAGIGEGDEVVTVAHSFIASALAVSYTGAKPVFVDINPETYTMDPNHLEDYLKKRFKVQGSRFKAANSTVQSATQSSALSPQSPRSSIRNPGEASRRDQSAIRNGKPKAILPVHLYGHPADMEAILSLAARYDLLVIEDACQAHGAEFKGKKAGALGHLGCFSFYPTKNLGGYGDGGMIVTDDESWYEKLRLLRNYGQKKKYHHLLKGSNSRLDEVQAAVLRVKLRYLDQWNGERRRKAFAYKRMLDKTGVICPSEREEAHHVYHLFVVRTRKRNALQAFLKEKGIGALIHYPIPIHLQEAYRELGYRRGDLPVTEKCARETLSLPFFPELTEEEMEEVKREIMNYLG